MFIWSSGRKPPGTPSLTVLLDPAPPQAASFPGLQLWPLQLPYQSDPIVLCIWQTLMSPPEDGGRPCFFLPLPKRLVIVSPASPPRPPTVEWRKKPQVSGEAGEELVDCR